MDLAARRGLDGDVYQPAEDSELLASAAREAVDPDDLVLEVGTGSGYVAAETAGATGARVFAADVNPHACRQAAEWGVEVVRADLVAPFCDGAFDVVLFNPPYLPTDPGADRDDWMAVALSGGESGRAVVTRFLRSVGRVLAPGGVVLLLVSSLSGVDEVVEAAGRQGFGAAAVAEESFPFETLTVLKLFR